MLLLPMVAFLYASVGHGGASSYLMLMTLFNFPIAEIRPTALILNIVVSGMAFFAFRKTAALDKKLFLSLILFSVPAAWLGGTIPTDPLLYKRILGFLLFIPILRFFNLIPTGKWSGMKRQWWMAPLIGLSIGFLSGLIGIGGGILLSPVLLLTGWTSIKQTSTMSALFIFLNSIAGLTGATQDGLQISNELRILLPLAIVGGLTGAWLGSHRFSSVTIRYVLSFVLLIAAIKLIIL